MTKKIAIFGTTPSRMEGPIQDDSGWLRWTIGPGGKDAHNWDRLYEVHHVWPEEFKGYLGDLSKESREVRTLKPATDLIQSWKRTHNKSAEDFAKDIPGDWRTNTVIPRDKLEEKYGRTWFSSSISWLCAEAIEEGGTDIGLWGIDLEAGEEYLSQYYGCRHFIDVARLIGINIYLPKGCGLSREPRAYPERYETDLALHCERKAKFLRDNMARMEGEVEGLRTELLRTEGRLLTFREFGAPSPEKLQESERRLIELGNQLTASTANFHTLRGEASAVEYMRRMWVYNLRDPELQ